ncbi:MAG: site-specific integrase [Myxococcales bacterium]|nr:site-specific integrase [Myxococcales bacterium]
MDHLWTTVACYDLDGGALLMGDIVRRVGRGGKFLGWYIRYKDLDGTRRQRASHQPTRALAARMLLEIEARIARGQVGISEPEVQTEPLTVSDLCERFLCEFNSPRIKHMGRYRSASRTSIFRVLRFIGQVPLSQLSRAHIEKARDGIARSFQPNTVRASMAPFGAALSWGVRQGLLASSPARGIELPRRELSTEYLPVEEASRLLAEAERRARLRNCPTAWSRFIGISLALRMGLRRGEVFGLRWQDIGFEAGRLTVAKSYRLAPKNGKPRHLPLPSALVPLLRQWHERCPNTDERLVCPVLYAGRWGMSSNRATHGLAPLLRAACCKPLSRGWHALRHTFASQFIMAGGNLVTLQKLLGHSSIEMTLVYSHLAPDFVAGEIERLKY